MIGPYRKAHTDLYRTREGVEDEEQSRAFAEWLRRYDADRDGLRRLAASARDYVRDTFTWPAVADQYVGVLERLVDSSGRASIGVKRAGTHEATTDARLSTL